MILVKTDFINCTKLPGYSFVNIGKYLPKISEMILSQNILLSQIQVFFFV